jgi:MFS family permease
MTTSRLWTKDFILIFIVNFFAFITFLLLMAVMSLFATETFGATQSQAGLTTGIFVIATLIARLLTGKYIDFFGRRKLLYTSLIIFLFGSLLYFFVTSLISLYLVRMIHGFAFGIVSTSTSTIVNDLIADERRGEGTGYFVMSANLAMAIGPFIGVNLVKYYDFPIVFVICCGFSVISLIGSFFMKISEVQLGEKERKEVFHFHLKDFFEPAAIYISICMSAVTFTYASLLSFIFIFADEIGLDLVASFFFIVYAGAILISRPFTGPSFDRYGENSVVYPSLISLAFGFLIVSQAHQGVTFLLAAALIGVGFGTIQSSFQAIAVMSTDLPHRRALATSTYYMFLDIANGLGPYVIGTLLVFVDYREMYLLMGIISIFCICLYYLLHGKKAKKSRLSDKKTIKL